MEKFNLSQRRFLADAFKDTLVNQDPDYFRNLGPTAQALMREAVNFTCMRKPLKGVVSNGKINEVGGETEVENVTIKIDVFHPGLNDKITLERTFTKSYLEQQ